MGQQVEKHPGFRLLTPVVFNCVCFRITGLDDAGNLRALEMLVDSGVAFLGPAAVNGQSGLRVCFMNLRTAEADVDQILDALADIAAELSNTARRRARPS